MIQLLILIIVRAVLAERAMSEFEALVALVAREEITSNLFGD